MPIGTIGELNAMPLRPARGVPDARETPRTKASAAGPADAGDEAIERAIREVNKMLDPLARSLEFSIDDTTGRSVVKLVDKETNEVLRQMPSREMLSIARALERVRGMLISEQA